MTNYLRNTALVGALFLLVSLSLKAQEVQKSIFDKMSYTEVLALTITADMEALSDKRSDKKHKGTLSFTDENGIAYNWDVKLKVRGKFRRMRCTEIPPLKIDFDKDDLREAGLTTFDDLKLVNQCMEDSESGEAKDLLLKEYLAYELYNEMTPESFRVQFLNINFVDKNTGKSVVRSGFFIEDAAQMRDRIGAQKVDQDQGFTADQFDQEQFRAMALFQYFIGNSDWSVDFGRNIKVVERAGKYLAVPYDFDFSGMVEAPYAVANGNYGLTSVKQRAYLGFDKDVSTLEETIYRLVSMRSQFKKVVKKHALLSRSTRNKTWNYLDSYFRSPDDIHFAVAREIIPVEAAPIADNSNAVGEK